MYKSKSIFWLSGIVVLVCALFLSSEPKNIEKEDQLAKRQESKPKVVDQFVRPVLRHEANKIRKTKNSHTVSSAPSKDLVRSEIQNNPHNVPSSFLDFSVQIAHKMKIAKADQVYAESLFAEFETCADESELETTIALRAYCLANAVRLKAWYPGLAKSLDELLARSGEDVLNLVNTIRGT